MTAATSKPIKLHEFTADELLQPGEHILCAVIIGPDRDNADRKTLHMRSFSAAVEVLQAMPLETRQMIMDHQDRLLAEFRKLVLR